MSPYTPPAPDYASSQVYCALEITNICYLVLIRLCKPSSIIFEVIKDRHWKERAASPIACMAVHHVVIHASLQDEAEDIEPRCAMAKGKSKSRMQNSSLRSISAVHSMAF